MTVTDIGQFWEPGISEYEYVMFFVKKNSSRALKQAPKLKFEGPC
jgi:hypothetical protein